jgi:hypothetical protein
MNHHVNFEGVDNCGLSDNKRPAPGRGLNGSNLSVISYIEKGIMVSSTGVKLAALVDGVDDLGLHPETRKAFGRAHDQSQETLFPKRQ